MVETESEISALRDLLDLAVLAPVPVPDPRGRIPDTADECIDTASWI